MLEALDGGLLARTATLFAGGTRHAEKLLANSDRWADRSVLSRDLIDLGLLRARAGAIPEEAWVKAESVYRGAVRDDLAKAARWFLDHEGHRDRCFTALGIAHPGMILGGVEALLADLTPAERG